ncbi:hypothetical protein C8R47DRAFT_1140570 [Mycena vitilis]|nr:hypothetical protein C8R47DRAFT_1140570 [Mycena vitilis]
MTSLKRCQLNNHSQRTQGLHLPRTLSHTRVQLSKTEARRVYAPARPRGKREMHQLVHKPDMADAVDEPRGASTALGCTISSDSVWGQAAAQAPAQLSVEVQMSIRNGYSRRRTHGPNGRLKVKTWEINTHFGKIQWYPLRFGSNIKSSASVRADDAPAAQLQQVLTRLHGAIRRGSASPVRW